MRLVSETPVSYKCYRVNHLCLLDKRRVGPSLLQQRTLRARMAPRPAITFNHGVDVQAYIQHRREDGTMNAGAVYNQQGQHYNRGIAPQVNETVIVAEPAHQQNQNQNLNHENSVAENASVAFSDAQSVVGSLHTAPVNADGHIGRGSSLGARTNPGIEF